MTAETTSLIARIAMTLSDIRKMLAECDRLNKPRPTEMRMSYAEWGSILDSICGGEPVDVFEQTVAGIRIIVQPDEPTIDQMKQDLWAAGWTDSFHGTLWTTPSGHAYMGPHKAWHIWAGVPMCEPKEIS